MNDPPSSRRLGTVTLVALVIGNMLGAGVFTTSGFALADLGSPAWVLLAWLAAGLLALCGAASYGALAQLLPVSGGEYYFLSRAVHPLAGFAAGWVSLWAGFTAAIAFAAITFEAYLLPDALALQLPANVVASLVILLAALAHGVYLRAGAGVQNLAVALKLALIGGFLLLALLAGNPGDWPGVQAWRATPDGVPTASAFAMSLLWISFSYSGFNAGIYVASEVADPVRRVPRALLLGTATTLVAYLALNALFLFAPAPGAIAGQAEIAALAAAALAGPTFEILLRALVVLALFTSISAMVMVGPRVYAQMAQDGLMPARLRFEGGVPAAAIALQALLAVAVVWLSGLRELLSYLGFTLGLCSAATVASLFLLVRRDGSRRRRLPGYPWAPAIYTGCTLLFCVLAARENPAELLAAVITIASSVVVYQLFGRRRQRIGAGAEPPARDRSRVS